MGPTDTMARYVNEVLIISKYTIQDFLISNFRCVLNVVCFLPGDSPAWGVLITKVRDTKWGAYS
jgi:hypothetical protein